MKVKVMFWLDKHIDDIFITFTLTSYLGLLSSFLSLTPHTFHFFIPFACLIIPIMIFQLNCFADHYDYYTYRKDNVICKNQKYKDLEYQAWYLNGFLHREHGPAVIYSNGHKAWFLNGREYAKEAWFNKISNENKMYVIWNFDE